jgi:hypothetical protein
LDVVSFSVLAELPTSTTNTTSEGLNLSQWLIPGAIAGGVVIVLGVTVVILKKR